MSDKRVEFRRRKRNFHYITEYKINKGNRKWKELTGTRYEMLEREGYLDAYKKKHAAQEKYSWWQKIARWFLQRRWPWVNIRK